MFLSSPKAPRSFSNGPRKGCGGLVPFSRLQCATLPLEASSAAHLLFNVKKDTMTSASAFVSLTLCGLPAGVKYVPPH